jgi:hypothetical protein
VVKPRFAISLGGENAREDDSGESAIGEVRHGGRTFFLRLNAPFGVGLVAVVKL